MAFRGITLVLVLLLAASDVVSAGTPIRERLHFSLIDQLPPEAGTTAINSLEERRRFSVFDAAVQELVKSGKLPPSELINREPDLRSGISSEKPQPSGTRVVRVFLTQWAETSLGGASETEILCRFFVEEVRDGKRLKKLGPYFSRVRFDLAFSPTYDDRIAAYQNAARKSLEQLAAELGR